MPRPRCANYDRGVLRRWRRGLAGACVLALLTLPLLRAGIEPPVALAAETDAEIRPGEVLVETDQPLAPGRAALTASRYVARVAPGAERASAAALNARPGTRAAPNYIRRAQVTPGDPFYAQQWALTRIEAPSAWDIQRGVASVTIAVLDSGADLGHPDLAGKLLAGENTLGAGSAACPTTTTAADDHSSAHGTHVAGIAGASTDDGAGVASLAWRPMILPIKVLDCQGVGDDAQIVAGIDRAIARGAQVINLSVGGPGQSSVLDAGIERAWRAGIIIVAAAGNQGTTTPFYPAASPHALAVGATDASDRLLPISNHGWWLGVVAPGSAILSTYRRDLDGWDVALGYQRKTGTSMASPHVAALAALLISSFPGHGPDRIGGIIRAAADRIEACPTGITSCPYDLTGHNDYYGHGRINAARALRLVRSTILPLIGRG
ncbi:MAG: hypothetical protein EPO26_15195 [Chloroflexota bacterium]|nr:MAG: hypothetical protein EPO26_15195 [Chloroflexota bacterium]